MPASSAAPTRLFAAFWSTLPHAPRFIAPKPSTLTGSPVPPRIRCSMMLVSFVIRVLKWALLRADGRAALDVEGGAGHVLAFGLGEEEAQAADVQLGVADAAERDLLHDPGDDLRVRALVALELGGGDVGVDDVDGD